MAAKRGKVRRKRADVDWVKVKAEWEADPTLTFKSLSERFGGTPTKQAIGQRAKRENWTRFNPNETDAQRAIREAADKMPETAKAVTGEVIAEPSVPQVSDLGKHAAIAARAQVIDRHRRELNHPRQRIYAALQENDFNKAKLAKISAETLSILQAAERKAWGLDGATVIVVQQAIPPNERDQHD